MRSTKTETGFSLLGGALLGAAAMYLLDPESGRRRRANASALAEDAWERAREMGVDLADRSRSAAAGLAAGASGLASGASDRFEDLRESSAARGAAHGVSNLGARVSDIASGLWDRARHLGSSAGSGITGAASGVSGAASGAASGMASSFRGASHSTRHALARSLDPRHFDRGGSATSYAATGLGTLVAGAAAMYFLDPQRGRGRRAYVRDQFTHIVNETGTAFRKTGTHLRNKMQGVAASTRGQVSSLTGRGDQPSGERLLQRIRSELGHVISRPTDIQLMTDAGGVVTIYGRIPSAEVDALCSCVSNVPGVSRVINRAEVQDGSGASSSAGGVGAGVTM